MEMKDKLEKAFSEALDNHELPYDAAAWNAVKKQLPAAKTPWYWMGGAAAVVVVAAIVLFVNNSSENIISEQHVKEVNANQTAQNPEDLTNSNSSIGATDNPTLQSEDEMSQLNANSDSPIVSSRIVNSTNANPNHSRPNSPLDRPSYYLSGVYTDIDNTNQPDKSSEWLEACDKTTISGLHSYYCKNSKVKLFAHQVPPNTEVTWLFSDGTEIKGENADFIAVNGLQVRLMLFDLTNRSAMQLTNWITLNIIEAQVPDVNISQSEKNTKTYIVLSNTNHEIEHLLWRIDNKVCKEQTCGTYLVSQGTHNYTVESYDKNGCFASVSGSIEVEEEYTLYVQSGFTPNGDGLNDVFLPEALKLRAVSFKMTIFDRNGKVLYETTDASLPWDGTLNGQTLEPGAYVWSVSLINEEGLPEQYRGVVTLLP